MQYSYDLPVTFTLEQIKQFGELTGDNGPVHSVDGVVQGGFIISMLPQWLNTVIIQNNLGTGLVRTVSMILETKFRNKLHAGKQVYVRFGYDVAGKTVSKLIWAVFDDEMEYCSGRWVIHKS